MSLLICITLFSEVDGDKARENVKPNEIPNDASLSFAQHFFRFKFQMLVRKVIKDYDCSAVL